MEFSIVKSTLPNYKYIFSGSDEGEIDKFLNNPRRLTVRIRGIVDECVDAIAEKLKVSVFNELLYGHDLNFSQLIPSDISVTSVQQTTGGRGHACIRLSKAMWHELFCTKASEAWHKIRHAKDRHRKRLVEFRKKRRNLMNKRESRLCKIAQKQSSKSRQGFSYKNVLIQIVSDIHGKLRARAPGLTWPGWNVSFPCNLRVLDRAYVAERVVVAKGFYRAKGKITRVI